MGRPKCCFLDPSLIPAITLSVFGAWRPSQNPGLYLAGGEFSDLEFLMESIGFQDLKTPAPRIELLMENFDFRF